MSAKRARKKKRRKLRAANPPARPEAPCRKCGGRGWYDDVPFPSYCDCSAADRLIAEEDGKTT